MKKVIGILWMVAVVFLFLSGCGVSQEDYDAVVAERDTAQAQVVSLESDLAAAESDLAAAQAQVSQLDGFKTGLTSSWNSLLPKFELSNQMDKIFALYEAGDDVGMAVILLGLTPYIDAVGDAELSEMWEQCLEFLNQGKITQFDLKFAEVIDKARELLETDVEAIQAQLSE